MPRTCSLLYLVICKDIQFNFHTPCESHGGRVHSGFVIYVMLAQTLVSIRMT